MGGLLDGQPGACRAVAEQRGSGQFGGKAIQRHGLQMIAGGYALQQRHHGHGAVVHGLLVGNVTVDADIPRLRVSQQLSGAPLALGAAQVQGQLCGVQGQAQQQDQGKAMTHRVLSNHSGRQDTPALR